MKRFSERKGYVVPSEVIQVESMDDNLRTALWSVLDMTVWRRAGFLERFDRSRPWPEMGGIREFMESLYFTQWRIPVDEIPAVPESALALLRERFFECTWYEVYDFLEFALNYLDNPHLVIQINDVLERALSGYRFVGGVITDITDKQEVEMLDAALAADDFPIVRQHQRRALELVSDRENPDYRNSIKESMSAVEVLAREITGEPKATLGKALTLMAQRGTIPNLIASAFSKLYGYTSDEEGIRHGMREESNLTAADAKFFLICCTSFINYLKSKL